MCTYIYIYIYLHSYMVKIVPILSSTIADFFGHMHPTDRIRGL